MKQWSSARSVITGAGSGFGRALSLELAGRGGHLVLSDINLAAVQETAQLARERGAREVVALCCDVRQPEQVAAVAAACTGPVELVVNNAGVGSGGLVGELPLADWRWTLDVDLYGVIHGCHVFTPLLRKQGHGHLLNVASAAGLLCAPAMAAYNVAKAGVIALSETLAAELAGSGVGVTVLCPMFFRTNIVAAGHFASDSVRAQADRMMAKARPVHEVVLAALTAVERNELYCVPMTDGRWLWRLKRAAPLLFRKLLVQRAKFEARLAARGKKDG